MELFMFNSLQPVLWNDHCSKSRQEICDNIIVIGWSMSQCQMTKVNIFEARIFPVERWLWINSATYVQRFEKWRPDKCLRYDEFYIFSSEFRQTTPHFMVWNITNVINHTMMWFDIFRLTDVIFTYCKKSKVKSTNYVMFVERTVVNW